LRQIAPGRYEALFTPNEQGVYLIRLTGTGREDSFAETTGWALSYSPEYKRLDSDPDLLLRLATIAGGQLASPTPSDVFSHTLSGARASRPIWPWLLLAAALLFPVDVALRRLIITRMDLQRAQAWIKAKWSGTSQPVEKEAQRTESMNAMLKAKTRVKDANPPVVFSSTKEEKTNEIIIPSISPSDDESPSVPPSVEKEAPKSTTEALLARKKNIKK
jgi:hypothetical protein